VAWELEDKFPGGLKVLLSSLRWERRLLRFLELSGVGRIVESGADKEATRLDGWVAPEAEKRVAERHMWRCSLLAS